MTSYRYPIRLKLLLTHLLVAAVALGVTGISFFTLLGNYTLQNTYKSLEEQGKLLIEIYRTEQYLEYKQQTLNLRKGFLFRLARQNIEGDFYLVSIKDLKIDLTSRPKMQGGTFPLPLGNAQTESDGIYNGIGNLFGNEVLYTVVPMPKKQGQSPTQAFVVTAERVQITDVTRGIFGVLLKGIIITVVVVLLIVFLFVRTLLKPFRIMRESVKRVAERDFSPTPILETKDEWEELSKGFHQMVDSIRHYNEAQRRFLQNASHEIKTPLMAIQGYAEGIRDGIFHGQEAEEGLEVISSESVRLKKLVDELIYLSKLETLDEIYSPEWIDLAVLIPDAISRIGSLMKPKGVEVRITKLEPTQVWVDPDKLTQALLNLLSNALRHANKEVGIAVNQESSSVVIQIWDDGSGIEESDRERIFERFYKGDKGDTGLGLAITRAIVQKSGGKIEAHNREPMGALFEIRLKIP